MLGSKLANVSARAWLRAAQGVAARPSSVAFAPAVSIHRRSVATPAAAYEEAIATRTFADFSVYKGKAAVAFKPIPPTFLQQHFPGSQNTGGYTGYLVDREGVLLLEFAPVLASQGNQSGYGNRSYDWNNKITFALKALELAQLTDLDTGGYANSSVELFHDPNKGSNDPNAVKTTKTLKFSVAPSGEGYMLTCSQRVGGGGAQPSSVTVPISRPEFVVLKHLAAYLIPRMFGVDMLYEGAGSVPSNVKASYQ